MTRIEEIMLNLNILHARLEKLKREASRCKYGREGKVEFAICKTIATMLAYHIISPYSNSISGGILHPQTLSRAFTKGHDVFAEFRRVGLQPPFRRESAGLGEEVGVVVHEVGTHSYGCLGGDVS